MPIVSKECVLAALGVSGNPEQRFASFNDRDKLINDANRRQFFLVYSENEHRGG